MIQRSISSLCIVLLMPLVLFADNVVMIGFWPPTNEMLRSWSTNPSQNLGGWQGENWEGLGHNVYSFFPEFSPDGNPFNDPFGSDGFVGTPESDFRVDYQDTSQDFWRVMDELNPTAIISYSRGRGDNSWEIERFEGGHFGGTTNPSNDWVGDGNGSQFLPTEATIDQRSWDAILTYRNGSQLETTLPVDAIVAATSALGTADVFVDETGTSGNFLSGFLGLHSLYYNSTTEDNLFAGHIHVGAGLSVDQATDLTSATLSEVLASINSSAVPEPSSTLLLALSGSLLISRRRRVLTPSEKI